MSQAIDLPLTGLGLEMMFLGPTSVWHHRLCGPWGKLEASALFFKGNQGIDRPSSTKTTASPASLHFNVRQHTAPLSAFQRASGGMATTLASILALQQEAGPRRDVGSWTQSQGTVQGQCFIHSPNGNIAYDSLIQLQYYSNLFSDTCANQCPLFPLL